MAQARLVDEFQFVILPIACGGGRTPFTTGCSLGLRHSRVFAGGNVVLTHAAT